MAMESQLFELNRLRAEELERNFYSLRTIEWQVYFQLLSGLAAITSGFYFLRTLDVFKLVDRYVATATLGLLCASLAIALYLLARVQERVHFTREMQNQYLLAMHAAHPGSNLAIPSDLKKPKDKHTWAARPMKILSVMMWLATSVAVGATVKWCA